MGQPVESIDCDPHLISVPQGGLGRMAVTGL